MLQSESSTNNNWIGLNRPRSIYFGSSHFSLKNHGTMSAEQASYYSNKRKQEGVSNLKKLQEPTKATRGNHL